MLDSKKKEQSELYKTIVGALIDTTPEHWYSFNLNVTSVESGMSHSIESNEGHSDIVSPSDAVFVATRRLQIYQNDIGEPINAVQFKVYLNDNDVWKYEVFFDYKA